jgi:hypothetical protein
MEGCRVPKWSSSYNPKRENLEDPEDDEVSFKTNEKCKSLESPNS